MDSPSFEASGGDGSRSFAARSTGQGRARGRLGTAGRVENVRRPDLKCRQRLQDEIEGFDGVSRRKGPSAWLSSESELGMSTMRISPAMRLSAQVINTLVLNLTGPARMTVSDLHEAPLRLPALNRTGIAFAGACWALRTTAFSGRTAHYQ